MYCVMRASVPSLHNVYRRYDTDVMMCNNALRIMVFASTKQLVEQVYVARGYI